MYGFDVWYTMESLAKDILELEKRIRKMEKYLDEELTRELENADELCKKLAKHMLDMNAEEMHREVDVDDCSFKVNIRRTR
jgi:hypothetical protein